MALGSTQHQVFHVEPLSRVRQNSPTLEAVTTVGADLVQTVEHQGISEGHNGPCQGTSNLSENHLHQDTCCWQAKLTGFHRRSQCNKSASMQASRQAARAACVWVSKQKHYEKHALSVVLDGPCNKSEATRLQYGDKRT